MSGLKISALPAAASAVLTDIFPVVQAGITKRETLQQVATLFNSSSVLTGFVPITGGTMTGPLILSGDPILPLGAATKQYVDMFASGIVVVLACQAGTTPAGGDLGATYNNGVAGIGATLTDASGTFAPFVVDGYAANVGDRILVKNQTLPEENGIYELTTNGDGIAIDWVLTRTTDYDQAPAEIFPGTLVTIVNGTVNAITSWLETATVTNIGIDPIVFAQFTFNPSGFLLSANNLSDVASVAASLVNLGLGIPTGTGNVVLQTSPTLITPILGVATATSLQFNPTTNGIIGTTTNDSALAGRVGEYIESIVLEAAAVPLITATATNVTSIALSAGDWDVWGNVCFIPANTTNVTSMFGNITTVSASIGNTFSRGSMTANSFIGNASATPSVMPLPRRISIGGPTTLFLVAYSNFSVSNNAAFGAIAARRVR